MILIKGAKIVDGTGKKAPYVADVLLQDNKISAIGKFPNKKAGTVIDGLGLYLTPGFIDVNTDSDHHLSLFTEPEQKDFLLQGVTTIFGGLCGSSLAPLISGNLNSIRKWTDTSQINVDWHTVGEFLKVWERNKLGVNFGTFVGHSTIRRGMLGESDRNLNDEELVIFKKFIEDSMKEGAFGFSTGLGYAHSKQVPYKEILELAKVTGKYNGVYATHLRDEKEGLLASIEETLKLAKEAGVKTIISHFKPIIGYEKDYKKAVELVHQESSTSDVHFDNYPFSESVVPIYTLLPYWAGITNLEVMLAYLKTPGLRERFLDEFKNLNGEDIRIAQAPGRDYLVGKTLHEFAENQGLSIPEALLKLLILTNLRALVFYRNINLDLVMQNLERDQVLIASNGASLPEDANILKHERFYNTFPKFIESVLQRKSLSLPQAIQKITSTPANKFNLANRGVIAEDWIADLNLISINSGLVKVESVFVNGELAVSGRKTGGVLAGQILRSNR